MDLFVPLQGAMMQIATRCEDREHAEAFARAWLAGYSLAYALFEHQGKTGTPAPADLSFELRPAGATSGAVQSFSLKPPVTVSTED